MRWIALSAVLAVSACVHSTPINGPDGKSALLIEGCKRLSGCFSEASVKCPRGYALLAKGSSTEDGSGPGVFVSNGYGGGALIGDGGSDTRHHIMVRCSS